MRAQPFQMVAPKLLRQDCRCDLSAAGGRLGSQQFANFHFPVLSFVRVPQDMIEQLLLRAIQAHGADAGGACVEEQVGISGETSIAFCMPRGLSFIKF